MRNCIIFFNEQDFEVIVEKIDNIKLIVLFSTNKQIVQYAYKNKIPLCYLNKELKYYKSILFDKLYYFDIDQVWIDNIFFNFKEEIKKSSLR